ncbi:MAG: ADP-ribosylation factor-like protein [Candidatus Hodarchaeota archaeon]
MSKTKQSSKAITRKILLMGLDNAGKTSIVLSLKRDTNLMSYFSVHPTRDYEIGRIDDQDSKFSIWDFGGQEQYRQVHLKKLDDYLDRSDKLIYVIDIQDGARYDLALNYLGEILKGLEKKGMIIPLSIFLHKFDKQVEDLYLQSSQELISRIRELIPDEYPLEISKTTIYTIFEKQIVV